jgi:hypothetical protein
MNLENYKAVMNSTGPMHGVSSRYAFVPTTKVLDILQDHGWFPAVVRQSSVKDAEMEGFQSHLVRLRNDSFSQRIRGKEYHPEILLRNSHNRGGAFELSLGLWRLVCSNGLVATEDYGLEKVRHVGFAARLVEESVEVLANAAPRMIEAVEKFRSVVLTQNEAREMAKAAIELKFNQEERKFVMEPDEVLRARRYDDKKPDLWTTFNTIQENLVKGGVQGRTVNGRRRTDRAVKSLGRDIKLNRALWTLAEGFAAQH